MKSIFPTGYLGSKNVNGLFQFIINHIPKHTVYVEGCLGHGIILQNKKPAQINIGIDPDKSITTVFNQAENKKDNLVIVTGTFLEFINDFFPPKYKDRNTFIYLDPPYLPETRDSSNRYNYKMSYEDHGQLLDYVISLDCNILISCYDSPLYAKKLKSWNKDSILAMTRGGQRLETIYWNYDLAMLDLHETTYVGKSMTDRQRIKRLQERHYRLIDKMPRFEKQKYLEDMHHRYFLPAHVAEA